MASKMLLCCVFLTLLGSLYGSFSMPKFFFHHGTRKEFVDKPNPCEQYSSSDKWITIQRRLDGTVDFYRKWEDYRRGFGSIYGEFWIGLDNLHDLTSYERTKLLIVMEDGIGSFACAAYKTFSVGSRIHDYPLEISGFSGDAGDSLTLHNGKRFSTFDNDNDLWSRNCAERYHGAWWYASCHESNLNGQYLNGSHASFADGVNWKRWKGYKYSLKSVEMMVAPYDP